MDIEYILAADSAGMGPKVAGRRRVVGMNRGCSQRLLAQLDRLQKPRQFCQTAAAGQLFF